MSDVIKSVTLLDCQNGEVIMIKFTDEELQEMKQYDDFAVFLSTLEDIYQFKMKNCHYMTSGEEPKIKKIGFTTNDEEYAQEVLRNDVLESDDLEDYYHQLLDKADEDDIKQHMTDFVIQQATVKELVNELCLDHVRCCSICGRPMTEGYCIENGVSYYCSDECLLSDITWDEYLRLYDDGNGDSYYTDWAS